MTLADRSHVAVATLDERSHTYVTPAGRVRYAEDALQAPAVEVVDEAMVDGVNPEFARRFHAIVEELTDELMASGNFDRPSCRADAITLLTAASNRLQKDAPVESPLSYLLMEEQQKASALFGSTSAPRQQLTFLKV